MTQLALAAALIVSYMLDHPSIFYCFFLNGVKGGGAGAYPSCLQARGRVHPGQVISSSLGQHAETNNISRLSFTLKSPSPYKRVPGTLRGFEHGNMFLIYLFWLNSDCFD